MKTILLTLLCPALIISCRNQKEAALNQSATPVSPIYTIAVQNQVNTGKFYLLEGTYLGFDARDCDFPEGFCVHPPKTRSDWVFSDGTFCAYVNGRVPVNLHPMEDKGKKVMIRVVIREDPQKQKFFELINIKFNQTN